MNSYRVRIEGRPETTETVRDVDSMSAAAQVAYRYGALHQWPAGLVVEVEDYPGGRWMPVTMERRIGAYYQPSVPADLLAVR